MTGRRTLGTLVALTLVGSLPATSQASFAKKIGSAYGGTLKSSKSLKTQQLTADPLTVLRGSTSTQYDPSVVHLSTVLAGDGFNITEGYVGVTFDNGETEDLISLGQFFSSESPFGFQETGYLQVFYSRSETEFPALFAETPGTSDYVTVDKDGMTEGDVTHTMLFDYIAENDKVVAKYRLYADNGSRGTSPDYLVSVDDPSFVIRDIAEANVGGALIPIPAAVGPGLMGLAGVVIHHVRSRKRQLV